MSAKIYGIYFNTQLYYNRFFEIFIKVTVHRVEPYTLCKFWYKRYYRISIPEYRKPSVFFSQNFPRVIYTGTYTIYEIRHRRI